MGSFRRDSGGLRRPVWACRLSSGTTSGANGNNSSQTPLIPYRVHTMASIPPPKGLRPSPWGGVPLSCGNLMRSRSAVDVIECLAEFAAQGVGGDYVGSCLDLGGACGSGGRS